MLNEIYKKQKQKKNKKKVSEKALFLIRYSVTKIYSEKVKCSLIQYYFHEKYCFFVKCLKV
jgi:hypothetical protein